MFRVSLILLLLLPLGVAAAPRHSVVPGGVAVVPLGAVVAQQPPPTAHFGQQRLLVYAEQGQWQALLGIGLSQKLGKITVTSRSGQAAPQSHTLTVTAKQYPEAHITLKDQRKVDPLAEDLERIAREQQRSRELFDSWWPVTVQPDFRLPVKGRLSGYFGNRRIFNGQPRQPHSGMDIAAAIGTPIVAPARGKIIEVGDYFFNGKTIFIDHGQGLITMFCHLNTMAVQMGQTVEAGQAVATVGMSGRATGPHLHWSVSLNGVRVDPALFLDEATVAALEAVNNR